MAVSEPAHRLAGDSRAAPATLTQSSTPRLPLWLLAACTCFLLLAGAARVNSAPLTDVAEYQCYALAFWHGSAAATAPSAAVCATYLGATPAPAFTTLPHEYGPLAILVFSLPLLGPAALYPWLFALLMLAIVLAVAVMLGRAGQVGGGHAWLLYIMLGSAATAAARFDVLPAACTLCALIALRRVRHGWAYAALAAGTLLKIYPALLLPLFLIESWHRRDEIPFWHGPGLFAGSVALVEGIAWLINPASLLAPAAFMQGRCVQVESLPATLSAVAALARGTPLAFTYSYNSICQVSPGLGLLSLFCAALALAGAVAVVAQFSRGALALGIAAILLLSLAMLGSKVFSPQYLLWVSPIIAWEYGTSSLRVFAGWCLVCLATTLCYPLAYTSLLLVALHTTPDSAVPLAAGLRNVLLVGFVAAALVLGVSSRRARPGYTARTIPESRAGG